MKPRPHALDVHAGTVQSVPNLLDLLFGKLSSQAQSMKVVRGGPGRVSEVLADGRELTPQSLIDLTSVHQGARKLDSHPAHLILQSLHSKPLIRSQSLQVLHTGDDQVDLGLTGRGWQGRCHSGLHHRGLCSITDCWILTVGRLMERRHVRGSSWFRACRWLWRRRWFGDRSRATHTLGHRGSRSRRPQDHVDEMRRFGR